MHAVFGGPKGGGADAFAGRQQRPWQRAGIDPPPNGAAEPAPHVAEVALLAAIDILADPTGKHQPIDAAEVTDRVGQVEVLDRRRQRTLRERGDQQLRHIRCDLIELLSREHIAARARKACLAGVKLSGRIEPHDPPTLVHHLQPTPDMQRRGGNHGPLLDNPELGGAAADIDIENPFVLLVRKL